MHALMNFAIYMSPLVVPVVVMEIAIRLFPRRK